MVWEKKIKENKLLSKQVTQGAMLKEIVRYDCVLVEVSYRQPHKDRQWNTVYHHDIQPNLYSKKDEQVTKIHTFGNTDTTKLIVEKPLSRPPLSNRWL